jgi:hypothetical protein
VTIGNSDLVGLWALDPNDTAARERMGDVKMELRADGSLTYLISNGGKKQVMLLRYRVDGSDIVTTQPSAPREERTRFRITDDDLLILEYEGFSARHIRLE